MANETTIWTSLIPVAVGGGIGIVGSLISPLFLEIHRHKKERLNITAAIISEISAITEVTDRRRYIEMLRNEINHLKTIDNPNYVGWFHFSVRRNPFQVYDANLERIGIISAPLSRDIVRFYSQAASILEDIADMRELKEKSSPNRAVSLQRLEQLLLLFEDTQALGKKIVAEIN